MKPEQKNFDNESGLPINANLQPLKVSEEWQVCPACNGTGIDPEWMYKKTNTAMCTICKGKKVISIQTGRPPE